MLTADLLPPPAANFLLPTRLPTRDELPDSLDIPVDNELQDLVPHLLLDALNDYWSHRTDWFFGINMGIFHTTGDDPHIPLIPDGFLSLGVEHRTEPHGRPSYIVWEEQNIVPKLVLECVSKTYGGEYDKKLKNYARLGILYYVVYNPLSTKRHKQPPLVVYRLTGKTYLPCLGEPVWLSEIGLGIGRSFGTYQKWPREWLYWYDYKGRRLLVAEERIQRERQRAERAEQRAEQAEQRAQRLAELLRQQGIDPDTLS